jgi:hypothetical protein
MNRLEGFKSIALGTEIDIAGTFIYNGIREFNRMQTFYFESESFSFLYLISVGIERLQKILIILLENPNKDKIEFLEKDLITHNHQELHRRICESKNIDLPSVQNDFLQTLSTFYKSCRYDRFSHGTEYNKEKKLLIGFISKHLEIEIQIDGLFVTPNDDRIKTFIGRTVGKIARNYYSCIKKRSYELNIYTYELRFESPAYKIFQPKFKEESVQEQYVNEQIALKELLVYLINTKERSGFYEFLQSINPLEFDIELLQEYVSEICVGKISQGLIDETETLYEEFEINIKDRLEMINCIDNPCICWDVDDEYDDEYNEEDY